MENKRKIIFGTDWWTDCDDCVALRLLSNAHKNGEIELIGVGINGCMEYSASSLSAFLTAEGLTEIPIGIDHNGTDFEKDRFSYQMPLCALPHIITSNEECESAVSLYKSLLSNAVGRVDIIEVGFPQVLAEILESEDGVRLFSEKVGRLYIMAGKWDEDRGLEHNFYNNHRSRRAGYVLCEKCPVPITFLGFEVGVDIFSGDGLAKDDHLALCLKHHGCAESGRPSWDPLTVLLAVIGAPEAAGYKTVCGRASVDPETGENSFCEGEGLHSYVVKIMPNEYYRGELQKRIIPKF